MIVWRRGTYRNEGVSNELKRRQVQSKPRRWPATGSWTEKFLPAGCCGCAESLCRLRERFAKLKKEIQATKNAETTSNWGHHAS